jgi:osmoprotectant transport system substrate-binding protein
VTLGTKNFPEQFILGELYGQALRAQGFKVTIRRNIGSSEVVDREVTRTRIDGYPEYTGTILTALAHQNGRPASTRDAYTRAVAFERTRGLALLDPSSAEDKDVLAVKPAFARRRRLRSLGDLRRLGAKVTLGAAAEFRARYAGDLRRFYGVSGLHFSPLTIGTQYKTLDRGKVQVAAVFTTDGQLSEGGYTLLEDPQNIFGFQNVTVVFRQDVLRRQGPAFARVLNAVSGKLSTQALRVMNASVVLDQQSPPAVAKQFLRANGLI